MTSPENTHQIVDQFADNSGCVLVANVDCTITEVVVADAPAAPDHKARGHAKISPSKLNYIDPAVGGCWGYLGSDETTAAAEEGTAHHELMDKEIVMWVQDGMVGSFEGHLFARRSAIRWPDEDDYLYRFCARAVDKFLVNHPEIYNEIQISIKDGAGVEITWGHFDLLIVIKKKIGVLVDWKFGIVPIVPAADNRQGFAYAMGVLQKWPEIEKLGVMFVQPRLNWVSNFVITRGQMDHYVTVVKGIVEKAKATALKFEQGATADVELNPGLACRYCTRAATCPAYVRQLAVAAPALGGLPVPAGMNIEAIDTPEKAALAVAWVDFLDSKLKELRKHALEVAERNGGSISMATPDGTVLTYDIKTRGFDRSLGETALVMDAVKEWVAPEEILAAATLSFGKFSDLVVNAMVERDENLTKKAAEEALEDLLSAHGLLSRPDGKIKFLQLRKEKKEPKAKKLKQKN